MTCTECGRPHAHRRIRDMLDDLHHFHTRCWRRFLARLCETP